MMAIMLLFTVLWNSVFRWVN